MKNEQTDASSWLDRASARGHSFDLAYWEQSLKPPSDPLCERIPQGDSTVWALRSAMFDQLQSAEEVRAQAIILIARLNGALRALCGAEPLALQGVARIDNGGNFHFTVFAEGHAGGRAMMTATAEVRDAYGNLIQPSSPAGGR